MQNYVTLKVKGYGSNQSFKASINFNQINYQRNQCTLKVRQMNPMFGNTEALLPY